MLTELCAGKKVCMPGWYPNIYIYMDDEAKIRDQENDLVDINDFAKDSCWQLWLEVKKTVYVKPLHKILEENPKYVITGDWLHLLGIDYTIALGCLKQLGKEKVGDWHQSLLEER